MNLSDITIKTETENRYEKLHSYWHHKEEKDRNKRDCARIIKTISSYDYRELILDFLDHESADLIAVNDNGKWKKYYKRKINDSQIDEAEEIAKKDRYKIDYFELGFQFLAFGPTARLKFAQKDGLIVVYKVSIDSKSIDKFSLEESLDIKTGRIHGIWIPRHAEKTLNL